MKPIVFTGHSRPIKDIQFNLEDDLLFTASNDRYVTLWSTETGERIGTYFHEAAVNCIKATPDSKYLISGNSFDSIGIWDLMTGKNLCTIDCDYNTPINSLDFGVSGREICATLTGRSNNESRVLIFNIDEALKKAGRIKFDSIPHKLVKSDITKNKINISRFINLNKNVLCAYDNGLVEIRSIEGELIKKAQLHTEGKPIMDLDLSSQEELGLTSSKDGKSVLFDPETLEILNVFKPENPVRNINSGKISPLFNPDFPEKQQLRHCIIGGGQESRNVTFTKSTEGGFEILIYDMVTGEELGSIGGHFSPINSIAVSNSGKIIVSGGEEATVRMHVMPEEYYQLKEF